MSNRYINLIARLITSIILAYPLSAVTAVIFTNIRDPKSLLDNPSATLMADLVGIIWFGIATPVGMGFAVSDEGGVNHRNMYPFIIPTAVMIFLILFSSWYKKFKKISVVEGNKQVSSTNNP